MRLYVRRVIRQIGSLIAMMNGIDMLVFTAGVGENSAEIRRHYNSSLAAVDGALGRAWHLSYDTRLFATRKTIQIVQADGMRRIFWRPDVLEGDRAVWKVGASVAGQAHAEQQAMQCVGSAPEDGTVTSLPQGGYRWPSGDSDDRSGSAWCDHPDPPPAGSSRQPAQTAPA